MSFEFQARLEPFVPKKVLEKHGEQTKKSNDNRPSVPTMQWCGQTHYLGTWIPITSLSDKTIKEQLQDSPTKRSELEYIKAFRRILESEKSTAGIIQATQLLSEKSDRFAQEANNYTPHIAAEYFICELQNLSGIGKSRAEDLYEEGFRSIEEIAEAGGNDLQAVYGIGESTASEIQKDARRLIKNPPWENLKW